MFFGHFDVPSDCHVQYLSLSTRSSDMGGMEGEIREVSLRPMP